MPKESPNSATIQKAFELARQRNEEAGMPVGAKYVLDEALWILRNEPHLLEAPKSKPKRDLTDVSFLMENDLRSLGRKK